jgi:hypothetical protein
MSTPLQP